MLAANTLTSCWFNVLCCPGGVGFDINCGVRLLRTNLEEKDVSPVKEQLAQVCVKGLIIKLDQDEWRPIFTLTRNYNRVVSLDDSSEFHSTIFC